MNGSIGWHESPKSVTRPTDQRGSGFARIVNGTVDIGAFEVQPAVSSNPAPIVTSISPQKIGAGNTSPVTFTVTGSIDGTEAPKIVVQDGDKKTETYDIKKVPEVHRPAVERLLGMVQRG